MVRGFLVNSPLLRLPVNSILVFTDLRYVVYIIPSIRVERI